MKKLFGRKKKAAPEPTPEPSGPIVTRLDTPGIGPTGPRRRGSKTKRGTPDTILASTLGG